MVKSVDTGDSESPASRHVGSSPTLGVKNEICGLSTVDVKQKQTGTIC